MADVDDRTDAPRRNGGYNNGGGHNRHGGGRRYNNNNYNNNNGYQDGGNRGRKRGRGEMDDDDNNNYNNRSGRNDRNDDRRQKQPRYTRPAAARLRDEILNLSKLRNDVVDGQKVVMSAGGKTREDECASIGSDIAIEWEDYQVRGDLVDTMVQFMLEQPLKIPFIAAIILYAGEKAPEVIQEMGKRVAAKAQDMLDGGSWKNFKLLLRFFALTQTVWEGDGVWSLLDELFDRAADFQAVSSSDAVGLELVQIILLSIPYVIAAADSQQDKAQELLGKTDIIASAAAEHELREVVNPFPTESDEKPYGYQSTIYLLQQQIQREADSGWAFKCIPRLFKKSTKGIQNGNETSKIPLPTINIPSPAIPGQSAFFPLTFFSIYAGQGIDTVPPPSDIASSLLRDAVVDTIDVADFSRAEVAKQLIEIDLYWATGTFAPRGTKPDKLKDIPEKQSTWKSEDVALDGIFSQIFLLPAPAHKLVYYHSVVTEVCRIAPGDIAPCLGRAIRFLFNFSDILDYELVYRFLDWFSHHLSNFDFRWKWDEWTSVLEQADFYPKKAFIIGILDKETRLSFAKRIKQTLPNSYQSLITQGKMTEQPEYKYKDKSTPYSQEGNELLKLLRTKQPEEEIQVVLDKIEAQAADQGIADPRVASTDAYMTAICFIGSKSTSHILAHIERCKDRLLRVGEHSEAARAQIVQSVVNYWKDLPGTAVNIIDKLLNYGIVTPACVIKWAIGPDGIGNGAPLSESWRFEMVLATIKKVTGRVRIIAEHRAKVIPKAADGSAEGDAEGSFDAEQIALIDQGLERERDDQMGSLFALINDLLVPTAEGSSDALLAARDTSQGGEAATGFTDADVAVLQQWAKRWIAVFARKQIVEQAIVGPAAVIVQTAVQEALRKLEARKKAEEAERLERIERERAERREKEEREKREAEEKLKMEIDVKENVEGNGHGDDLDVAADADGIE